MKLNLNYREMSVLSYGRRQELPLGAGIYFVGNYTCPVMYIGLTRNLKNRHLNHHRQAQFEGIEGAAIRYRILPDDMLAGITNLRQVLNRLEKQAINYYKPSLNDTPVPNRPAFITPHGPIYVQTHKVNEEGYCEHFDHEDGGELGINTGKLSLLKRAIAEQRPIFLITSGYYEDYKRQGYPNLSDLAAYANDRIYLLVSRFIPYGYEESCSRHNYIVYGSTAKVFTNPYIILNNSLGFKEFRESYLKLGFTNCERSPFAKQLLRLSDFNLLSPV